jgi:pterin-4a-carbinolamine dehydratase
MYGPNKETLRSLRRQNSTDAEGRSGKIWKGNSRLGSCWLQKNHEKFRFENFLEVTNFVNRVAQIAEKEEHHPDIYIFYNRAKLELWTHAVKGLSENDFILAAKINP